MARPSTLLPLLLFIVLSATTAFSYSPNLRNCLEDCETLTSPPKEGCKFACYTRYHQVDRNSQKEGGEEEGGPGREERGKSPYFFDRDSLRTAVKTRQGNLRYLDKFSDLLRRIENYRIVILEAKPRTLVLPDHWDADAIVFVAKGSGIITLLSNENKKTFKLCEGDLLNVPAGTPAYIINTDKNDNLHLVKLIRTVSVPGTFEIFYGIGSQNAESIYLQFSREIVEAAFNAPYEQVKKVFEVEDEVMKPVSAEEYEEIVKHASSSGGRRSRPSEGECSGPFNILSKRPTFSNQHGKVHEANASDYEELRHSNVSVSLSIINGGSMLVPIIHSRATSLAVVLDGKGVFEILCPHVSERGGERGEKRSISYRKLGASLQRYDMFAVPPGHPLAVIAEPGQRLVVVCFQLNAENDEKILLAGKGNFWNNLSDKEKELLFKMESKEVDQVLEAQKERGIVQGPRGRKEGGSEGRADE